MSLSFQVSKISGAPVFDSLPVAKITRYPLEKRDYKPYAQCSLCVGEKELILRMWAFEVSPLPGSCLRSVLYLFPGHPEDALCVDIYATDHVQVRLLRNGQDAQEAPVMEREDFQCNPLGGEDLQGAYWGNTVTLPLAAVERLGGKISLDPGGSFPGNFYKLCNQEPFVHSGSCFDSDFTVNPYTRENMGVMQVVAY